MARKSLASLRARQLLESCGARDLPTPVELVAEKLGIRIEREPSKDEHLSGCIVISDGRPIIGVNSAHSRERQRFTIAHELGHFVLHRRQLADVHLFRDKRASEGSDPREVEANTFAAELLMPRRVVRQMLERLGRADGLSVSADAQLIASLSSDFHVSIDAMKIRLATLGYITV